MSARRRAGRTAVFAGALAGALALAFGPTAARAQTWPVPPRRPPVAAAPVKSAEPEAPGLRGRVGLGVATRLLDSDEPDDRLRGIERLGAIGTTEAVAALVDALGPAGVGRDARARLAAVRALAPFVQSDRVRQALVREIADATSDGKPTGATPPELVPLLRDVAALALASSADKKALGALISTVARGDAAGAAAARALAAAPPRDLDALTSGAPKGASAPLVALLGELDDLRAVPRLRAILREGDAAARVAAARALARLGDDSVVTAVRGWIDASDPKLSLAAAEVLATRGAPDAVRAVAALLRSDKTAADGLRLARIVASVELVAPVVKALAGGDDGGRVAAIVALGAAGGPAAVRELAARVRDSSPAVASAAARALASVPGADARRAIAGLLTLPASGASAGAHLRALRAATTRALELDESVAGLDAALDAAARAPDAARRAAGTFGLVALGKQGARDVLERACGRAGCDVAVVAAVSRALLARPNELPALAPVLERARPARPGDRARPERPGDRARPERPGDRAHGDAADDLVAVAAGTLLLSDRGVAAVSTADLIAWAEGGGALAPLAARALGARDGEVVRPTLRRLLAGTDPLVRAHAALGLAASPDADAVSLLAQAYEFEPDAPVRRAVVRALSARSEAQRRRVLVLAQRLDPDAAVRTLAREALAGRALVPRGPSEGRGATAWIELVEAPSLAGAARSIARAARVTGLEGIAIPIVTDADGVALVPAMSPGPARVVAE